MVDETDWPVEKRGGTTYYQVTAKVADMRSGREDGLAWVMAEG